MPTFRGPSVGRTYSTRIDPGNRRPSRYTRRNSTEPEDPDRVPTRGLGPPSAVHVPLGLGPRRSGRGQAEAPPGPPPPEHVPAPRGSHSGAKSVGLAPTPSVWLKRTLHRVALRRSATGPLQRWRGTPGARAHYNTGTSGRSTRSGRGPRVWITS